MPPFDPLRLLFRLLARKSPARDPRHGLGARGEEAAAAALRDAGMEILGRNLRSRLGELDIVARDGGTLVFVEVKSRSEGSTFPPELSVTSSKQRKLRRLAEAYLSTHERVAGQVDGCRFDVVAVTIPRSGRPKVRHLRDAFQ